MFLKHCNKSVTVTWLTGVTSKILLLRLQRQQQQGLLLLRLQSPSPFLQIYIITNLQPLLPLLLHGVMIILIL